MRELIEVRVAESDARANLPDSVGQKLGMVRRIVFDSNDTVATDIARIEAVFKEKGDVFILFWEIKRMYARVELGAGSEKPDPENSGNSDPSGGASRRA